VHASRNRTTDSAECARAREWSTDGHDHCAVHDCRLPVQRQWRAVAMRDGTMDHRLDATVLKRSTTRVARQPVNLRSERNADADPRDTNTRHGDMIRELRTLIFVLRTPATKIKEQRTQKQ
jgi:hypothetical protein